ncbi:hypothetical protein IPP92_03970 [Candidatus Saccharibacteria bacterium]|nr:MAG: hypothetical protein IPP92_03970 [Candidatus Saccharibacteria bacterium]
MAQVEMLILSYLGEPFSVALEERPGGHGLQPPPVGGEDEAPQGTDEEGGASSAKPTRKSVLRLTPSRTGEWVDQGRTRPP